MCPYLQVWNPAFDVTPSSMITGVITERGVIRQEQGRINVHAFMVAQGLLPAQENGHTGSRIVSPIPGFKVCEPPMPTSEGSQGPLGRTFWFNSRLHFAKKSVVLPYLMVQGRCWAILGVLDTSISRRWDACPDILAVST